MLTNEFATAPDPSIVPVVKILENLFQQLNGQFFESKLSTPVITVSPNSRRKDRLSWCTTQRVWKDDREQGESYFEINVCAEYLNLQFEEISAILLHEMCHLLNVEKGVNDTCRAGTYHNEKFKDAAIAHGLIPEKVERYGYCKTRLSPEAEVFVKTLEMANFTLHREKITADEWDSASVDEQTTSSTRRYACPECGNIVRATKDVKIRCEDCDVLYRKQ